MGIQKLSFKSIRNVWAWAAALVVLTGVAACAPATLPAATQTLPVITLTSLPTFTVEPSLPPTETVLPGPTLKPTKTIAPAWTSTPPADFSKINIIGLTSGPTGISLVAELAGVNGGYTLELGGLVYQCATDEAYPDRLFCQGLAKPVLDQDISLKVASAELSQRVYSGRITIPSAMFATQVPDYYTYNACPERGQNVSCETECRIAPDGNPCIVSTCTDTCGAYFAVDTCPLMSMDFNSCTAEQWQQMKARYNIP